MRSAGRRTLFSEINITPLTDIFLVLLIIMMVVAPMLDSSGLKLDVPSVGPSAETKEKPKAIEVTIAPNDKVSINGQPYQGFSMANALRGLVATHPDGIIIRPDAEASHGKLAEVMDAAQSAGITKMGVTGDNSP
jgi:biopolymer transport protein ExbD